MGDSHKAPSRSLPNTLRKRRKGENVTLQKTSDTSDMSLNKSKHCANIKFAWGLVDKIMTKRRKFPED